MVTKTRIILLQTFTEKNKVWRRSETRRYNFTNDIVAKCGNLQNQLKNNLKSIERTIQGITLRDEKKSTRIREQIKIRDIITVIKNKKGGGACSRTAKG